MCPLWINTLVVWVLLIVVDGDAIKQTSAPLFPHKPFVVLWNAPTEQCQQRYKVDLDLDVFDIIANPGETLNGPIVTIYYHNQLGTYPYIEDNGVSINGGIPQNESLFNHLIKARSDINNSIPMKSFQGLGVIDWEEWRPQWIRNWGTKDIYRNKSIQLVQMKNSQWPESKIKDTAKDEFERSGKNFMNETLFLAKEMRSDGYWGYYLYPDCYNYDYKNNPTRYTGKCPLIEIKRNDELLWLWQQSSALYPSIYLDAILQSSPNALKFVHYRVKEAMRIASIARTDYALPVYVYGRPFYSWTLQELTEEDLVSTIGESAAMGVAGVVLWGSMQYASTKDNCVAVKKYVEGPLGHYIVNVTYAAKLCSKALCQKNGRCIRKNSDSYDFLHLPSDSFKILIDQSQADKKVTVQGSLKQEDVQAMNDKFHCQCYQGWEGLSCETSSSTN
ncbi:Hyaluronidase [Varanus komodoensis]|uniref:hyaluronidase-like n=1 Tax=Varanus komodoensis TaxID=61221 RepID=UPI001CF76BAB|nr:hyaluronidase-like [Varanus komodoensis]KAF7246468.1 Hyaluronidase [Varanus komodoensis]